MAKSTDGNSDKGYLVNLRGLTVLMCNFGLGISAKSGFSVYIRYVGTFNVLSLILRHARVML